MLYVPGRLHGKVTGGGFSRHAGLIGAILKKTSGSLSQKKESSSLCRKGVMSGGEWGGVATATGFVGEYLHTVDSKGRLALPVKFRESLGPRFMIARGLDKCLAVYPSEEWALVLENVKALPQNQKEARAYARYFLSGATEVDPDKQGRVLISQGLREYAGLGKDVYVLGVGNRVEIWDKAAWDNLKLDIGERFSSIAESVPGI